MTIGDRLRMLRGNLSQREAANRVGMKQQMWRVYESNASAPGAKLIMKICETFGCKSDWLLGLTTENGRIVATNSAVVIGSGTAINNAEPGASPICRKCEIRKRMEKIAKLSQPT